MSESCSGHSSSKLQQDDPSIIHCSTNELKKKKTANAKHTTRKDADLKQKQSSYARPKTVPTKPQQHRKSEPVSINQRSNWQRSVYFPKHEWQSSNGFEIQNKRTSNLNSSKNLKPQRTFVSHSASNSSGGQQKWNRSVGTPSKRFPKTGTPIDNLISVSGLNNVKTTNPSKPQITSDVIKKNSKSLKDTEKTAAESSTSKGGKNSEIKQKNKTFLNTQKKTHHSKVFHKEIQNDASAKEVDKKRNKKVTKKNKKVEPQKTSNSTSTNNSDKPSRETIEKNKEAGRKILSLVNGGPKQDPSPIPLETVDSAPKPMVKDVKSIVDTSLPVTCCMSDDIPKIDQSIAGSSLLKETETSVAKPSNTDVNVSSLEAEKSDLTPSEAEKSDFKSEKESKTFKKDEVSPNLTSQIAPLPSKQESIDTLERTEDSTSISKPQKPLSNVSKPEKAKQIHATDAQINKRIDEITKEHERLEQVALEQAAQRLEKDQIVLLTKKSMQFPNAKFYCTICFYHLDGIPQSQRHVKEKRHKKNLKEFRQDEFLKNLKMPPDDAVDEIQQVLIKKVLNSNIMTKKDVAIRKEVVERLNQFVQEKFSGYRTVLYGSSLSSLGFQSSDINVDLQHPKDVKPPTALLDVLSLLDTSDKYLNVKPDFHAKFPHIDAVDSETGLFIQISTGNDFAILTSRLLAFYTLLDERVLQLSMIFRTWAHMCELDLQHDGGLPPHAIPIMSIFFLQVRKYIPVLHEVISEWDMEKILSSSFDCPQLEWRNDKLWYRPTPSAKKHSRGEISSSTSDSESDEEMSYVLQDTTLDFSVLSSSDFDNFSLGNLDGSSSKEEPGASSTASKIPTPLLIGRLSDGVKLATLFLEMLKFYALDYEIEEKIINIRSSQPMQRSDKKWSRKRIAVIDPYLTKRNLCRSLNSQGVFNYFVNRLKDLLLYFYDPKLRNDINQKPAKPTVGRKLSKKGQLHSASKPKASLSDADPDSKTVQYADCLTTAALDNVLSTTTEKKLSFSALPHREVTKLAESLVNDIISDVVKMKLSHQGDDERYQNAAEKLAMEATKDALKEIKSSLRKERTSRVKAEESPANQQGPKYCYDFTVKIVTGGKLPIQVCGLCKREGHPRVKCPDDMKKPVLAPLLPLTGRHIVILDRMCHKIFEYYLPSRNEVRYRDRICQSLSSYLQQAYNVDAHMSLFGSSRNGFGFRDSDLDICLTFQGNPKGENLDPVLVIQEVAKQLRKNPDFWNIVAITTAKVPIVKFMHQESALEGDISLYNLLAQRNTSMLRFYSLIDRRCQVLGYVMKAFAKLCNIGDASRGSLSSYAYTLLVIFYLQQKSTPVLPVLQELYDKEKEKPSIIVDGWNSWFYDNIENLRKVWPGYKKNKESVGQLWLGLLRFYTEEFNFKRYVVCTRQKKLLTTFEKEWTSKFISIEDPFDLNHNLAAGVSHKMTKFIVGILVKAREHFSFVPPDVEPFEDYRHELKYFFDPKLLTNGQEAPNDRCCRICGKIGHFIRDCPKNKRNRRMDGKDAFTPAEMVCFYCNEVGHIKKDCPALKNNAEEKPQTTRKIDYINAAPRFYCESFCNSTLSPGSTFPREELALERETRTNSDRSVLENETGASADSGPKAEVLTSPRVILTAIRRLESPPREPSPEKDQSEDIPKTQPLPRSLSEDPNVRSTRLPSNRSRRLFERSSESDVSSHLEVRPPSSPWDQIPERSFGLHSVPLTSPRSFSPYPSSSSKPLISRPILTPPNFHSSPSKGPKHQLSSSAPAMFQPPTPLRPMTAPFPISPWPNSTVWGFSANVTYSPLTMTSSPSFNPNQKVSSKNPSSPSGRARPPVQVPVPNQRTVTSAPPNVRPLFFVPQPGPLSMYPVYGPPAAASSPPINSAPPDVEVTSPLRHQVEDTDESRPLE